MLIFLGHQVVKIIGKKFNAGDAENLDINLLICHVQSIGLEKRGMKYFIKSMLTLCTMNLLYKEMNQLRGILPFHNRY